jgi:hypothetical protein
VNGRGLVYKSEQYGLTDATFACRICKAILSNPEKLRIHSMEKHKGHMILSVR